MSWQGSLFAEWTGANQRYFQGVFDEHIYRYLRNLLASRGVVRGPARRSTAQASQETFVAAVAISWEGEG